MSGLYANLIANKMSGFLLQVHSFISSRKIVITLYHTVYMHYTRIMAFLTGHYQYSLYI